MSNSPPFGLTFGNIPLINLRAEFKANHDFLRSPTAAESLSPRGTLIQMPLFLWGGQPADLMTLILQRAILGLEAYVSGALWHTAQVLGVATPELIKKIRNPSSFEGKSMVRKVFDLMPAAVNAELSLRHLDQKLYEKTTTFYKTVRNPLFHGKQLEAPNLDGTLAAFDHIAQIYKWVDCWHDPEKVFPSSIQIGPLTISFPLSFLEDAP